MTKPKAKPLTGKKLAKVLELFKVREGEAAGLLSTGEIAHRAGVSFKAVDELRKSSQRHEVVWQ